jgi:hypothetical protein
MQLILTTLDELAPQIIPGGLDPARQTLEDMAVASASNAMSFEFRERRTSRSGTNELVLLANCQVTPPLSSAS